MKGKRFLTCMGSVPIFIILILLQACSFAGSQNSGANASVQKKEQVSPPAAVETKKTKDKGKFAYDSSKPLNVQKLSTKETETGVKINEISYEAYDKSKSNGGKVNCYLVEPKGKGPFPAVIYFHWLGKTDANKGQFLDEASTLADKGIAGLLIDGFFPWKESPSELEKDKSQVICQVIDLERAVDYIAGLPNIDPKRISYVGHDYGAMYGTVLSGIDNRINNYVFVAGMGNFGDWFITYWLKKLDDDGRKKYYAGMEELDPINYIKNAAPAKMFFQFSNNDKFITKKVADDFYGAAPQPKEVKFYDADHEMKKDEIRADRQKWLLDNIK